MSGSKACYCDSCAPVHEQIAALTRVLRQIQDADGHSYKSYHSSERSLLLKRERERRYREQGIDHHDPEKRRESNRRYRERNRERIRERNRAYNRAHPRRNKPSPASKTPEANRRRLAYMKKRNAESLDTARRHGQVWTGPEMEIAARNDLPVPELAKMLGRTIAAVYGMRRNLHTEPKYQQVAGLGSKDVA